MALRRRSTPRLCGTRSNAALPLEVRVQGRAGERTARGGGGAMPAAKPCNSGALRAARFETASLHLQILEERCLASSSVAAAVPLLPAQRILFAVPTSRNALGIGLPAPPASSVRMTAAAMLAGEILGGTGRGGRLDVAALAHTDAQAHFTPRHDDSLWIVTASVPRAAFGNATDNAGVASASRLSKTGQVEAKPTADTMQQPQEEQTRRLEAVLRNILARLGSSPPAPLELLSVQRRLLARMDAEMETNEGLAAAVGYADITGGDMPETLRQRIQQTTAGDVQQFVARYLLSQPGVTVLLQAAAVGAGGG